MKRRDLIIGAGTVLAIWPIARAEGATLPVVGLLAGVPLGGQQMPAFLAGLADGGYREGRDVAIKTVSADNDFSRLPALAAELARDHAAVIVMPAGLTTEPEVISVTGSIPIVFRTGTDPVALGLVPSLNRPGGKLTGVLILTESLVAKNLEILNEVCPGPAPLAVLMQPNLKGTSAEAATAAGEALRRHLLIQNVTSVEEFEPAVAALAAAKVAGLAVPSLPLLASEHRRLASLAAKFRIPTIYDFGDIATSGGFMSYGADPADTMRQLGRQAARILSGTSPADVPILQPDRFRLVISLKEARALGINVPPTLLARADQVIE